MSVPPTDEKTYWLDDKRNVDKVWWALIAGCAVVFVADAFYQKHPEFEIEYLFGFYGLYGFIACVFVVLLAKALRRILMRPEDYYDG